MEDSAGQRYAWNWFALHSSQRMQPVGFWLVATAFLTSAFVEAVTSEKFFAASGVALVGAASSAAFLLLDRRTRALVRIAEGALAGLEDRLAAAENLPELRMVMESTRTQSRPIDSYRTMIWGLQGLATAAFVVAGFIALMAGL